MLPSSGDEEKCKAFSSTRYRDREDVVRTQTRYFAMLGLEISLLSHALFIFHASSYRCVFRIVGRSSVILFILY